MKKVGIVLVVSGLFVSGLFAFSDFLGFGKDEKLGAAQLLGIQFGAVIALLGLGFITIKRDGKLRSREIIAAMLKNILDLPPIAWVLAVFLVLYFAFFLYPAFLTKLQIQYFQRYIPDAFVTHIGFDIESIVRRIQDWINLGQSPYADGFIAYPPLTILVFAPFIVIGFPAYYRLITAFTFICYLLTTLLIPKFLAPKRNHPLLILFFIMGLFSYGLQFELERGQFNLIAFTLCLLAIYLFHYHHKFRYFAYLLFSLSVQLKVYPAIFIVMFIKDWRAWKENLSRVIGLGLFNFSLLFILGYQMFDDFINSITNFQLISSSRYENLSLNGFVHKLTTDGFGLIEQNQLGTFANYAPLLTIIFLTLCGLCFVSATIYAYLRKSVGLNPYLLVICTVEALVLPSISNDYKLSILTTPMLLALSCLPNITEDRRKISSILLIITTSTAFWSTLYPYNVKPQILASNFPALMMILISMTALFFVTGGDYELRTGENQNKL